MSIETINIEACVQLLERLAAAAAGRSAADVDYAERHERTHPSVATDHYLSAARFAAEATLLGALASALPGIAKDAELGAIVRRHWQWIESGLAWATQDRFDELTGGPLGELRAVRLHAE